MRSEGTQGDHQTPPAVYCAFHGGYNPTMLGMRIQFRRLLLVLSFLSVGLSPVAVLSAPEDLHIEISKRGLGKEVVITQGVREWFMLVEVTPENTVIVRQEKDRDQYLIDESETHDRPLAPVEVDAAINDYINSVKARIPKR